jgi:hypothetical protein
MARRHNTAHLPSRGPARLLQVTGDSAPVGVPEQDQTPEERAQAAGWMKGQLLNVRNAGGHYNVTLLGEEYDPSQPERCLQFTQPNDCQNFVSAWYSRGPAGPFG